jgi:translation initiation factor IF-2
MIKESIRINKVLKEFNIGMNTLVDFLEKKSVKVDANPNAKLTPEEYDLVEKEFRKEQIVKEESKKVAAKVKNIEKENVSYGINDNEENKEKFIETTVDAVKPPKVLGKIDLSEGKQKVVKDEPVKQQPAEEKRVEKREEPVAPVVKKEEVKEVVKPAPEIEVVKEKEQKEKVSAPAVKTEVEKPVAVKQPEAPVVKPATPKAEIKINPKPFIKEADKNRPFVKEQSKAPVKEPVKTPAREENKRPEVEFIATRVETLSGPEVKGSIDLSKFEKKKPFPDKRGKRERIHNHAREKVDLSKEVGTNRPKDQGQRQNGNGGKGGNNKFRDKFKPIRNDVDEDAVQRQIKETYQRMVEGKGKTKGSKYRKEKREMFAEKMEEDVEQKQKVSKVLKVTEFVTVNDLSVMIAQPVTKVIEACMNLGLMVSINQRLDADALTLVAEEFGYKVEFVTADIQEKIKEENEEDKPEDLQPRAPIVTVMGHVDHGKTSLLDYIRQSNVIAGEAGGITQHIGAYNVKLESGRRITFLDTPGHEAFTAMRARGAKMTDLAIIIVAADDAVMPQTIEAINHAQAAGVPMIFAINKIDKPGAQADKIKEQLSQMDILVEDWGGKYQCQEISAKKGTGVHELLEKVLLEADLLELKANPNKKAVGTVIESSLDKGRGYLATLLVQGGTLHTGDIMLSGCFTGKIKAMFNERGQKITEAGPSVPVSVLGLNGAPQAGDSFNIFDSEREARDLANKREQLLRIQGLRTQKHITLEEIGRRIAIGNFKELNIIVKGDVDGSIEAMSDSLIKLSNEEIHVNVIHKAVGEISESDVLLAEASNAIIIGFQVRPSSNARKMAEKEGIEIRLYSVIYDAINEVKSGIEGMLAPVQKEVVTATCEVRQTFKISKVGTIAGCMVKEGKLTRTAKIRLIRDGIVVHTGLLASLKRGKDDAKEVLAGYDCGLGIENFNDIKEGDVIEAYKIEEIKRTL